MEKHGLIMVHTGDGKGKTTAALGLAMRAWGDGLRVLILQFIKGGWNYGELKTIEELGKLSEGRIRVEQCGKGFTNTGKVSMEEHKAAAHEALEKAEEALTDGQWDLVILDEMNYAVKYELVTKDEMMALLDKKPADLHVVLTGRDACEKLIERADLVTEMHLVKHPYDQGVKAQKGIEF